MFPVRCPACGSIVDRDESLNPFCRSCTEKWNDLRRARCKICKKPVTKCTCSTLYNQSGNVREYRCLFQYIPKRKARSYEDARGSGLSHKLVYIIKHKRHREYMRFVSAQMAKLINKHMEDGEYVIAYPPRSSASKFKYGFDHTAELARNVARILEKPLYKGIQRRSMFTPPQKSVMGNQRGSNAYYSYYLKRDAVTIKGETIVLIDDVVTTGATSAMTAALLLSNGAETVYCFSIARTAFCNV